MLNLRFFLFSILLLGSKPIFSQDAHTEILHTQDSLPLDSTQSSWLGVKSYSFLTGIAGVTGLAITGGADDTYPVFTPMTLFGFGTLASALVFDLANRFGINGDTTNTHYYDKTYAQLGYVNQNNHQDPYHLFLNYRIQYAYNNLFYKIHYEHESHNHYREISTSIGWSAIKNNHTRLVIIPEFKHKNSAEGFGISQSHILAEVEFNIHPFWSSLNGFFLFNQFGLGYEYFWFESNQVGFTNGIMILGQGIRFHPTPFLEFSTQYKRREDELIGSRNWTFLHLEHSARYSYHSTFLRLLFTHGQGYRISFFVGANL